jgi:ubiquitin-conjugating enzyme E2 J2
MLAKDPVQCVRAAPNPDNILEWHFLICDLDDDRYRGGFYHGVIVFPADYPYKPPSVKLNTPSGRFAVNTKLCLSITDFHPESWNPLWSVSSMMAAIVSFFVEDLKTYGSIRTSRATKQSLATKSLEHNVKTSPIFRTLFPDLVEIHKAAKKAAGKDADQSEKTGTTTISTDSDDISQTQACVVVMGMLGVVIAMLSYVL